MACSGLLAATLRLGTGGAAVFRPLGCVRGQGLAGVGIARLAVVLGSRPFGPAKRAFIGTQPPIRPLLLPSTCALTPPLVCFVF